MFKITQIVGGGKVCKEGGRRVGVVSIEDLGKPRSDKRGVRWILCGVLKKCDYCVIDKL